MEAGSIVKLLPEVFFGEMAETFHEKFVLGTKITKRASEFHFMIAFIRTLMAGVPRK